MGSTSLENVTEEDRSAALAAVANANTVRTRCFIDSPPCRHYTCGRWSWKFRNSIRRQEPGDPKKRLELVGLGQDAELVRSDFDHSERQACKLMSMDRVSHW